ncbi:MAG: Stp1/IreP family PP2C-type Ser/Thr phosphatase [Elusimicrobiales bacterium]
MIEISLIPEFAFLSDKGKVRSDNQDSVVVDELLGLAAVADGMGGHNAGEIASDIAITAIKESLIALRSGDMRVKNKDPHLSESVNDIHFAAIKANEAVHAASMEQTNRKGMGTTLSAILLGSRSAAIAHIGDSRIYLYRESNMVQLTSDHSLVMEQVRKGIMTKEEAEISSMQNILTRAMGITKAVKLDVGEVTLADGDRLLLCSDGLFKAASETDMRGVLSSALPAAMMCRYLVDKALENGGPDNVSVVVIKLRNPKFMEKIAQLARAAINAFANP